MSGSSSEKQKESVIRAELKRCMSIERRWNRNEVSRELLLLLQDKGGSVAKGLACWTQAQ